VENPQVLTEIMRLTTNVLLTDKELPVKVEAGVANVFNVSGKFEWKIRIKEITLELLTIIRETENEDFNTIETLLSVMEEHPEIMANLQVVRHIFQQSVSANANLCF
jgi:hypothetical protein